MRSKLLDERDIGVGRGLGMRVSNWLGETLFETDLVEKPEAELWSTTDDEGRCLNGLLGAEGDDCGCGSGRLDNGGWVNGRATPAGLGPC